MSGDGQGRDRSLIRSDFGRPGNDEAYAGRLQRLSKGGAIGMLVLILGLILFLGIHSVRIFAPATVDQRESQMGEGVYKGIYSVVSLVGFVLIVWGYGMTQNAPVPVWEPPLAFRHIATGLMLFSFLALGIYALPAGRLKPMFKHPMLIAIKIWALAHLLANGELGSIVLFGAFLIWAVADRISVKRRAGTGGGAGIAQSGPVTWDIAALLVGIALYIVMALWLHEWLIGVAPIAV
ncbi:NnrU family protein [Notoacmeibacter sp. MSK16QG-6]|uniref:NnrU family protein n=1 Tax=Notoacmeibacter sp. MSK16QG-6 TaxID=2957982 RepID=UPI0020A03EE0|nr:NnrU family protein [Notoacmeibacter sp. MSK16QG-6]MCP1198272.1 NnrU family protein [Notoacmeibacter sp. MSK16QG-6]